MDTAIAITIIIVMAAAAVAIDIASVRAMCLAGRLAY